MHPAILSNQRSVVDKIQHETYLTAHGARCIQTIDPYKIHFIRKNTKNQLCASVPVPRPKSAGDAWRSGRQKEANIVRSIAVARARRYCDPPNSPLKFA